MTKDDKVTDVILGFVSKIKELLPKTEGQKFRERIAEDNLSDDEKMKKLSPNDRLFYETLVSMETNPGQWEAGEYTIKHKKSKVEIWTSNRPFADLTFYRPTNSDARPSKEWLRERLRNAIDTIATSRIRREMGLDSIRGSAGQSGRDSVQMTYEVNETY